MQQFLLRLAVGEAFLHRRFDQFELCRQRCCPALKGFRHGRQFLIGRTAQGFDRFLYQFQRFFVLGQAIFEGSVDQVEFGCKGRGSAFHHLFQCLQALSQRAGNRADGLLKQGPTRFFVGQAFGDGRLDEGEFRLQTGGLALHGVFNGGEFLGQRAGERSNRLLDEGLLRLAVGKAARNGRLDESEFRLQAGRLILNGRLDGGEFLGQRAGERRDGLLQQLLCLLTVGKAPGHCCLDQLQLFRQRLVGTVQGLDDLSVVRLHGDTDLRITVVAPRKSHRRDRRQ